MVASSPHIEEKVLRKVASYIDKKPKVFAVMMASVAIAGIAGLSRLNDWDVEQRNAQINTIRQGNVGVACKMANREITFPPGTFPADPKTPAEKLANAAFYAGHCTLK